MKAEWVTMLVLAGEIDGSNIATLRSVLGWADDATILNLDMHQVGFIGSEGLRAIVELCARDVDLHVWHPSRPVRRAFEVSRLDELVTIHD